MVRQYIGARYVPKFYENSQGTAEWRSGVIFEPLTIVTWNGNSYTSKKAVPAEIGDPSNNPDYWVATGLYNQQIADMIAQFDQLQQDVQDEIAAITARKVIFIGDSYCGVFGTYAHGIYTTFINSTKLSDGVNCWMYALGGAGFAGAGQGKTFGDLLEDAYNAHVADAAEITDVFICGGANDAAETTSDINTAKDAALAYIKDHFPNAITHIAMLSGFISVADRKQLMQKVRYVYYYNLPNNKVKMISNAHFPMMLLSNFTDNVHPNAAGCRMMGTVLADHFWTGNSFCEFGNSWHLTTQIPAGADVSSIFYLELEYDKTGFTLYNGINRVALGISDPDGMAVTHNGGITLEIGSAAALAGLNALVPNAESVNDNDPVYSLPCSIMGFSGDYSGITWVPIAGELLAVTDNTDIKWYFKANTAPKSFTIKDARWSLWKTHVAIK